MTEEEAFEIKFLYEVIEDLKTTRDKIKEFYKRKKNLDKLEVTIHSKNTNEQLIFYSYELNNKLKRKILMIILRDIKKELTKKQQELGEIKCLK